MDPARRSMTRESEVSSHQELVARFTRKIGRNAAYSGGRVDRVWTWIRQHHNHVARVAVHLDVSGYIAHP